MTVLTEGKHAGEFLLSEGNGLISREVRTIAAGQNLAAGTVLGKITSTGKYAAYNNGASDGTETAVEVLFDNVDASAADVEAVTIARNAEVNGDELTGLDAAATADLLAANIIIR